MAPHLVPFRPVAAADVARISMAALIVACLSSAPFVSLSRWVTRQPLALETWPYQYTIWGAALLGSGLFVLDVVAPLTQKRSAHLRAFALTIAPAGVFVMWVLASVAWTDSPARTPPQALLVLLVLLTAVWFGFALTFRQQALSLFATLHVLTIASLVAAPTQFSARYLEDNSWIGVFSNPNSLGPVATLGVVAAAGAWQFTETLPVRVVIVGCVVVDVFVAQKTKSLTGWMALAGAGVACAVLWVGRWLLRRGVPIALVRNTGVPIILGVYAVVPWILSKVGELIDNDATLTGRRDIWEYVVDSLHGRWAAGFGWFSFWDDPLHIDELVQRSGRGSDSAHSTFFEVLLFLGVVGLLLVIVVVAVSIGRTWWEALGSTGTAMMWWAAVGTFCLLENVTESMIAYHSIFWVLLVASGFAALRGSDERREHDDHAGHRPPGDR